MKTIKMKQIKLPSGETVQISDCDFAYISQFRWYKSTSRNYPYRFDGTGRNKKAIFMHREILGFPKKNIDHADGNIFNNQRENLRICGQRENIANSKLSKANSTGFKGVRKMRGNLRSPFSAQIMSNYTYIHLGYFGTAEEAAKAYDKRAKKLFGDFARLNFPGVE